MAFRISQTVLVAAVAFLLTLLALNNLTDYGSNLQYVAHVLSMDTTFPDNQLKWRALTNPIFHHLFYCTLILWEVTSGGLCWVGACHLYRALRADGVSGKHQRFAKKATNSCSPRRENLHKTLRISVSMPLTTGPDGFR
jgi:predicted small integral membrane protein